MRRRSATPAVTAETGAKWDWVWAGDDAGQGGLAAARRPPEDHRGHLVGLDDAAQHAALADQVLLADELVEAAGAHAGGQGRLALGAGAGLSSNMSGGRPLGFPGVMAVCSVAFD